MSSHRTGEGRRGDYRDRPTYQLVLRPEPGVDGDYALKQLEKAALRWFGLRCIDHRKKPPELAS